MKIHWIISVFVSVGVLATTFGAKTGPNSNEDSSYSHYFSDAYYYAYDWLAGSLDNCPFRENMMESIKHNLARHIRGQNEGLDTILSAISAWEFQRQSGQSEPLVLALTGPTGVGKSETSFRLAEGALAKRSKVGRSLKYRPNGLLTLRGEDYTDGNLAVIHEAIRDRVIDHLEACSGNAVIVFDEVQKVMPGTLEVLMPAFETRGSLSRTRQVAAESALDVAKKFFSYTSSSAGDKAKVPVTTTYSTENVIFIFISDIGADMMTKLVLTYGNRSAIPQSLLRNEVKTALDEQWSRLRFGKVVREVVPYLPLEPEHIRDILLTKLSNLATDHRLSHWRDLKVDEDVVIYLSDPPQVKYSKYSTRKTPRAAKSSSTAGGGEESGNNECTTDSAGNTQCSASAGTTGASDGNGSGSGGSSSFTSTKLFATWGARSLENAGPLQDLKGKLSRYAQPWRPDQILHVGLATEANRERRNLKWGTQEKPGTANTPGAAKTIYIQWCKVPRPSGDKKTPSESLDEPSHSHNNGHSEESELVINDDIAFSDACETKWYGPLIG